MPNSHGTRPHPTPPEQKIFAPKDTLDILKNSTVDNYALYLQRLAIQVTRGDDRAFRFFYEATGEKNVLAKMQKAAVSFTKLESLLESLKTRQAAHLQTLCGDSKRQLQFKPDWRMIVGLGGDSVYETSITLHHVYGIPYIPASALKGVTRSCWIQGAFGYDEQAEKDALKSAEFRAVFGGPKDKDKQGRELPAQAGDMVFFDAFPLALSENSIEVDIMNPHYGDYYGESYDDKKRPPKIWPTDTQNPVPVHFLTVANTSFSFAFGCRPGIKNAAELLENTEKYLRQALTTHGIGAKSAVGYGYMRCSNS